MLPATADIYAPDFPESIEWINAPFVRLGTLLGRNVALVWFWDCASMNSLRALPYVSEWHRRYSDKGLRVIGVHSPQFDFGRDRNVVLEAVERLEIEFPVAPDPDFQVWRQYGNEVWPALYLWDRRGVLAWYHFAEGAYEETERAIQAALRAIDGDVDLPELVRPMRPTDRPGALVRPPTPHRYLEENRSAREVETGESLSIRYTGATAAAVLDGSGHVEVRVDGSAVAMLKLRGPRLYELWESGGHEPHELTLEFLAPARAYMFSFAPAAA